MVRFVNWDNLYYVKAQPGVISIVKRVAGAYATIASANVSTTANEWYTLRVVTEGADMTVYRTTAGELEEEIVSASDANAPSTTASLLFWVGGSVPVRLDNIRMLSDDLETQTVFAYNGANELTKATKGGVDTTYEYDAWGQTTLAKMGAKSAAYAYHYGGKLTKVESDFFDQGVVTYDYGGDGKRRTRTEGGELTQYNWTGWTVQSEENSGGTLTKTYLGGKAEVSGSNPATGSASYYTTDNLGSTRAMWDADKAQLASLAYSPYGEPFAWHGAYGARTYTGHAWDGASAMYFAPYRYYAPGMGRWITRDPEGMIDGPNVYGYVRRVMIASDLSGLGPTISDPGTCFIEEWPTCMRARYCPILTVGCAAIALACALAGGGPLCSFLGASCGSYVLLVALRCVVTADMRCRQRYGRDYEPISRRDPL